MRAHTPNFPLITSDQNERMRDRSMLKIKDIKSNDRNSNMRYKKAMEL